MAAIFGSFQFVIVAEEDARRSSAAVELVGFVDARQLKMTTTAPSAVGTWSIFVPAGSAAISSSFIAASDAPKSTVCSVIALMPPPEPIDW